MTLRDEIAVMQHRGESLQMNWGEDTGMWECSWIIRGKRYTGISRNLENAVHNAKEQEYQERTFTTKRGE